ncbi:MAG: trypsin-like peptidase domain-containing protein [Clostridia bacterium]
MKQKKALLSITIVIIICVISIIIVTVSVSNPNNYKIDGENNKTPIKGAPVINIENRPSASNNYKVEKDALSVPEIAMSTGNGIVSVIQYKKNEPIESSNKCSGIIISSDGYIMTSAYLIKSADGISVTLSNNDIYQGFVIGVDSASDIAIIKINASNLYVPPFGDTTNLFQGEDVVTIGALSDSNSKLSVSHGVASAIIADKTTQGGIAISCIETDAVICDQNTGGALTNIQGQVIGMISNRFSDTKTNGFGYAISIAGAKGIVSDLVNFGHVKNRARLGVTTKAVDDVMIKVYDVKKGLYVVDVDKQSDAYSAGLEKGNVIVAVNGNEISENSELSKILFKYKPGDKINLTVEKIDNNGTRTTSTIRVSLMEDIPS